MLFKSQPIENQELYKGMIKSSGALSKLFSENSAPYFVSRNIENAYCEAFGAENLGRADCSADASLGEIGVGIKTFLHGNGKTLQKVAEFNKDAIQYRHQQPKDLIKIIANLRNERIEFTERTYKLKSLIYHCVTRKTEKVFVFESPMNKIDISKIANVNMRNKNTITFEDGLDEYSFNLTKSTLYKRFYMKETDALAEFDVKILDKPYLALSELYNKANKASSLFNKTISNSENIEANQIAIESPKKLNGERFEGVPFVILPLFSDRGNKRHVQEKSGLNQWHASGRVRHQDEIYIPIPKWIHDKFIGFFPGRDVSFQLRLPDRSFLDAKVCQDNSKALMSNPNKDLGNWMLRTVLDLEPNELLTYEKLEILGIDSVIIYKHSDKFYSIDFCELGSFDEFQVNNQY